MIEVLLESTWDNSDIVFFYIDSDNNILANISRFTNADNLNLLRCHSFNSYSHKTNSPL